MKESSPVPTSREFWLGYADLRPLGVFRILLGLVTLWDIFRRSEFLTAWHTDLGVLPRAALVEGIARPWRLSLLDMMGTPGMVTTFFVIAAIAALGLTLGYRTRLCTMLCWLFVVSATERNLGVTDSSDTLHRVLLFWMMFAPAGAVYSLDRALDDVGTKSWPPMGSAVGFRFMQLQVLVLYTVTSITKGGIHWLDGSAVYRALQVWDFARPTATFFVDNLGFLSVPMTWSSLALELCVAPALVLGFYRVKLRRIIIVAATLFHLGIETMLNVGMFSLMMPMTYTLFLWPQALDWLDSKRPTFPRLVAWFRTTGQKILPDPAPHHVDWVGTPRNTRVLAGLGVLMAIIIGDQFHEANPKIPRPPEPLVAVMESMSLWQNWRMFAPNPVFDSGPWTADGVLADGLRVDVLAVAAPEFGVPPGGRWVYSRWNKYRLHVAQQNQSGYLPWLARYLCAQYNSDARAKGRTKLESLELVFHSRRSHAPWEPENPIMDRVMHRQRCP